MVMVARVGVRVRGELKLVLGYRTISVWGSVGHYSAPRVPSKLNPALVYPPRLQPTPAPESCLVARPETGPAVLLPLAGGATNPPSKTLLKPITHAPTLC